MVALPTDHPVLAQEGVLTCNQVLQLYSPSQLRAQLAAKRWQQPVRGGVVLHNGPLTDSQQDWVALLSCAPRSALSGVTGLRRDGFQGFEFLSEQGRRVTQPPGARRPANADVIPHWSTMLDERDVHPLRLPRRTRPARGLLDEASWSPPPRLARALILAGIQQRLAPVAEMRGALSRRGPCRHRALIVESMRPAGSSRCQSATSS
jgi:hypothetical protein